MAQWEMVHVVLRLGEVDARVGSFDLVTEVGRPWRAQIAARVASDVDPASLLGAPSFLAFGRDAVEHAVSGVVTAIEVSWATGGGEAGTRQLDLVVESQMALLRETTDCRIFQEMDVRAIVTQVLGEHGIGAERQRWQLVASYTPRVYCVMWNESAFDFVSRLCEAEGIFWTLETGDEGEVVVFSDDSASAPAIDGGPVAVRAESGLRREGDGLGRVSPREVLRTGKVTLRDFAFETPTIDLESLAEASSVAEGEATLEQYAFGRGFATQSVGDQLAQVRLEALRADRRVIDAQGRCARLRAGALVTLEGAPLDLDATYFIRRCRHQLTPTEGGMAFVSSCELIPKETPFRLAQTTPRPLVRGPGVAFVVAPDGAESETIHTDEHGRVKVRFPWDRSGKAADDASCWMRVAQLQTSGSLMLPRVGWEVVVEHTHGDPDRPMVTGRVYNGATKPPYALPEGKTRTSLQTASSPGGGGRNEIRFEDKAGSEEIRIEAQKGHTLATAGNKDTKVGANSLQEVGGTRTVTIAGTQTIKVTGGATDGVKTTQTVIIGGNRTVNVNAARTTKSGATTIAIGGSEKAMVGNPLQGALDLAAAMVQEAVAAKVAEAFEALDAAAAQAVDQIMAPVNDLAGQVDQLGQAMADIGGGDVAALGSATELAQGLTSALPTPSSAIQGALGGLGMGDLLPAGWGGAEPEAGESSATGGGDGGGSSGANEAGPAAAVGATAASDDACGPGHAILDAGSTHTEKVGSLRVVITAGKVTTIATGARTSKAGAAKIELVAGNRTEACDATKSESALGLVVLTAGNETETIEGDRTTKVGGAILDKVTGSASLTAGGTLKMAGAFVRVKASSAIVLKCGGSEVTITGGGIELKATLVQIAAAKIEEKSTTAAGT